MKLHLDKNAFSVLLEDIHNKTGYRTDVLEKDYYVVLILQELSELQTQGLPAYFKGGTALYKALKKTNRFSEDIDISVDARGCSRSKADRRLEKAAKRYKAIPRNIEEGRTNRSEVISVYNYQPVTVYDSKDALQRFGKLKVEATSFTISEPVEALEVGAMLYDLALYEQKRILREVYEMEPFMIQTITIERIFVDKLFAAEAYVRRAQEMYRAFEAAKHIYDLAVLAEHSQILNLLNNEDQLRYLLNIRLEEEHARLDGIPGVLPVEFGFFTQAADDRNVRRAYAIMQNQYVLNDADKIDFDKAVSALCSLQEKLIVNPAWVHIKNTKSQNLDIGIRSIPQAKTVKQKKSKVNKEQER